MHGVSPFLWSIESRDNLTEHERPGGEHEGNFLYVEVSPVFLFVFVFLFFFVFENHEGNFLYVEQQCLVLDLRSVFVFALSLFLYLLCLCFANCLGSMHNGPRQIGLFANLAANLAPPFWGRIYHC